MINNILFPTDFSENAKNAIAFAVELAKKNNAKLFFAHTYETPLLAPSSTFVTREQTMADSRERMLKAAEKNMQELLKSSDLADVSYEYFIVEGEAVGEIQELITNNDIDMVVMGTKGESAKRELFLGSVTKKLIQELHCPVIAIPGDYVLGKIEQIVYATDLKDDEAKTINYLVKIARLFSATLTILHLDKNEVDKTVNVEELKKLISNSDYAKIEFKDIVVNNLLEGIESYVKENHSSILTMTTKTTGFFEKIFHQSATKEILFHTHIPILAFNRENKDLVKV